MFITGNNDTKVIAVITELHNRLIDKIKVIYPFIDDGLKIGNYEVNISNRLQVAAGNAQRRFCFNGKFPVKYKVCLNYRLLVNNPEELEKTYAHELAHIICYILYPIEKVKHGTKWIAVMNNLGYLPEVTHNLDTSHLRRARVRFDYACSNYECGKRFKLTTYKHNRSFKYRCNLCKSSIGYIGEE